MAEQPRYDPLEPSRFFADGRSAREPVPGTVARGRSRGDTHFLTGKKGGGPPARPLGAVAGGAAAGDRERPAPSLDRREGYVETFPFPVTAEVMRRGRERFTVSCVPCHGRAGTGSGLVIAAGYPKAQTFHTDRLRQAPVGYLFDVVTRGYNRMPSYAGQVSPEDRWAILAYLRALQLSRHAELKDLPPEVRKRFEQWEDRP